MLLTLDDLKAAIDTFIATKTSEMVSIVSQGFPGAVISNIEQSDQEYSSWLEGEGLFSSEESPSPLGRCMTLQLPTGLEVLLLIEFNLLDQKTIGLQGIMLNLFLHSRVFSDEENLLLTCYDRGCEWFDYFGDLPDGSANYEQIAEDMFQLFSQFSFKK